jgi:hypothetical protein
MTRAEKITAERFGNSVGYSDVTLIPVNQPALGAAPA